MLCRSTAASEISSTELDALSNGDPICSSSISFIPLGVPVEPYDRNEMQIIVDGNEGVLQEVWGVKKFCLVHLWMWNVAHGVGLDPDQVYPAALAVEDQSSLLLLSRLVGVILVRNEDGMVSKVSF